MDIGHIGAQQFIGPDGILAALNKVGKVKNGLEVIAVQLFHQVGAAVGHVAVDVLFVFMEQDQVLLFGLGDHGFEPAEHLVPVPGRVGTFRHEKAEYPDIAGVQGFGDGGYTAEFFQMGCKIVGDVDFADGGADGGDFYTGGLQFCLDSGDFLIGQVGDVLSVHAADLDELHTQSGNHLHLFVKAGVDLVRKAGQLNMRKHISFFLSKYYQIARIA